MRGMDNSIVSHRNNKGQFTTGHQPPVPITRENAPAFARLRAEKARRASAKGVLAEAQAIDPTVSSVADAIALLVRRQVQLLMDADRPHVGQVLALSDRLTGMDAVRNQAASEPQQIQYIYSVDADTRALLARIAQTQAGNAFDNKELSQATIDATVTDAGTDTAQAEDV